MSNSWADAKFADPSNVTPAEPCENCGRPVKATLLMLNVDVPSRTALLERVQRPHAANGYMESWTEHTPERCQAARRRP